MFSLGYNKFDYLVYNTMLHLAMYQTVRPVELPDCSTNATNSPLYI